MLFVCPICERVCNHVHRAVEEPIAAGSPCQSVLDLSAVDRCLVQDIGAIEPTTAFDEAVAGLIAVTRRPFSLPINK